MTTLDTLNNSIVSMYDNDKVAGKSAAQFVRDALATLKLAAVTFDGLADIVATTYGATTVTGKPSKDISKSFGLLKNGKDKRGESTRKLWDRLDTVSFVITHDNYAAGAIAAFVSGDVPAMRAAGLFVPKLGDCAVSELRRFVSAAVKTALAAQKSDDAAETSDASEGDETAETLPEPVHYMPTLAERLVAMAAEIAAAPADDDAALAEAFMVVSAAITARANAAKVAAKLAA